MFVIILCCHRISPFLLDKLDKSPFFLMKSITSVDEIIPHIPRQTPAFSVARWIIPRWRTCRPVSTEPPNGSLPSRCDKGWRFPLFGDIMGIFFIEKWRFNQAKWMTHIETWRFNQDKLWNRKCGDFSDFTTFHKGVVMVYWYTGIEWT